MYIYIYIYVYVQVIIHTYTFPKQSLLYGILGGKRLVIISWTTGLCFRSNKLFLRPFYKHRRNKCCCGSWTEVGRFARHHKTASEMSRLKQNRGSAALASLAGLAGWLSNDCLAKTALQRFHSKDGIKIAPQRLHGKGCMAKLAKQRLHSKNYMAKLA